VTLQLHQKLQPAPRRLCHDLIPEGRVFDLLFKITGHVSEDLPSKLFSAFLRRFNRLPFPMISILMLVSRTGQLTLKTTN